MKPIKYFNLTALSLVLSAGLFSQAATAQELVIENFIGTVTWSNDDGKVRVVEQKNVKNLNIYDGDAFIIDGGVNTLDGDKCQGYYGNYDLSLFKKKKQGRFGGYEDLEDYPVLSLTMPRDTKLVIRNAIIFTEGAPDLNAVDLSLKHCGKINLGDVTGAVNIMGKGSADVTLGNADAIVSNLSGSSDIDANIVNSLRSEGYGSGDIHIKEVTNLDVSISGSGDLEVETVRGDSKIQSSGSGDVDLETVYGALDYKGAGSGDFYVEEVGVRGPKPANLKSAGSGDVTIDDGELSYVRLNLSGSSNADIDAIVEDVEASASGSSDIYIRTVTGSVEKSSSGSSSIKIDNRD